MGGTMEACERAEVLDRYLTRARAFERISARRAAEGRTSRLARGARRHGGHLTRREIEVLLLVSAGCSNAEIAGRLVVSEQTVKAHLASILGKLGAQSRAHAVAIALLYDLMPRAELIRSLARVDLARA